MKRILFRYRLTILIVATLSVMLTACTLGPEQTCRLELTAKGAESEGPRTVLPEISMDVAVIAFSGVGPGGNTFNCEGSGEGATVQDIIAGSWTVTARGMNSDGICVLSGSTTIEVKPYQENRGEITLEPLSGEGELEIMISWPEYSVYEPAVSVSLSSPAGAVQVPPFLLTTVGGSCSIPGITSGYYTLSVVIHDGEEQVGGFAEIVRIVSGYCSRVSFPLTFAPSDFPDVSLKCAVSPEDPVEVSIVCDALPPVRGEVLDFSQTVTGDMGEDLLPAQWFLNGVKIAEGPGVSLDTSDLAARNRLDVLVRSGVSLRAGSAGFPFSVGDVHKVGGLLYRTAFRDGDSGADGLSGCRKAVPAPDGKLVFTVGFGEDGIGVFRRKPDSGTLSFLQCIKGTSWGALRGLSDLTLSPDGSRLFSAASGDSALTLFAVDSASGISGSLASWGVEDFAAPVLAGVSSVCISSCGGYLYTAGDSGVGVFRYDSAGNSLTLLQGLNDADGTGTPFAGPLSLRLSPDGQYLTVSDFTGDRMSLYSRNPADGSLEFHQSFTDEVDGVSTLNGPEGSTFSPDSSFLYTASYYDNSVTVFSRNAETGMFEYLESHRNGSGGIHGLKYAKDVILSPDGSALSVSGSGDDALAVFSRDPQSGLLQFNGAFSNSVGGIETLDSPRSMSLSPDGRFLFLAAAASNAFTVFEVVSVSF